MDLANTPQGHIEPRAIDGQNRNHDLIAKQTSQKLPANKLILIFNFCFIHENQYKNWTWNPQYLWGQLKPYLSRPKLLQNR